jgi:hypothetical protein
MRDCGVWATTIETGFEEKHTFTNLHQAISSLRVSTIRAAFAE